MPDDRREELFPIVYEELRSLARRFFRRERPDHTLQPTALVHETYLRLAEQSRVDWQGRTHVMALGAEIMRRVLVDHARRRLRRKRGAGEARVTLDEALFAGHGPALTFADLVDLHEALSELERLDSRQARIVALRYFGGLSNEEVGGEVGVSTRTVEAELTHARAWLRLRLGGGS